MPVIGGSNAAQPAVILTETSHFSNPAEKVRTAMGQKSTSSVGHLSRMAKQQLPLVSESINMARRFDAVGALGNTH
jgi:hypothetical protein